MKLSYNRNSKNPIYYISQSIRNGKKTTSFNVCKIGKHSELLAQGIENPLEYAKNQVKKYNNSLLEEKVSYSIDINFAEKVSPSVENTSKSLSSNIGYFYLQFFYSKLKIKNLLNDISKDRKFNFNLNDITRFLVFDRILYPKSKLATVNNLNFYYEKPEFSHQNVLRAMDVLSDNYDLFLNHLFTESNNIVKRDTSVCYYDCTNYYFEIESPDEQCFDDVTGEYLYGLRQYGPSKEHRPNPIVEMGLFMDKDGIPITMGLFPGNMNEQKTVANLETKMIKSLNNKKLIYCGDAGLGSASIRTFNDMGGRAFIVTQSIKKLSESLQNELLKDEGFKLLSSDDETTISKLKEFDKTDPKNIHLYNDKAYKSVFVDSNIDLGLIEEKKLKNGNTKLVKSKANLKQRIIITYSRKMAEYQKIIRNKQIERAKILISKGVDDIRKGPNDIARFIKNANEEKNTYVLDQDRIEQEEKFDGFYAIATNLLNDSAKEIFEINDQRYKIEDCFRVLKTNFDARPVYHRLDNRIVAHFMICYTSLLIYRLLEKKLKEKGYHFTINEILTTLKNMNISNVKDRFYQADYAGGNVLNALCNTFKLQLDKKYYLPKNLKKFWNNFRIKIKYHNFYFIELSKTGLYHENASIEIVFLTN
mgnify:CR=1 FL=1